MVISTWIYYIIAIAIIFVAATITGFIVIALILREIIKTEKEKEKKHRE